MGVGVRNSRREQNFEAGGVGFREAPKIKQRILAATGKK
jgi:hypothetical protein